MPNEREYRHQILRSSLIELSELISVLTAVGQIEVADQIFQEQRRIADRLARLQEGSDLDQ